MYLSSSGFVRLVGLHHSTMSSRILWVLNLLESSLRDRECTAVDKTPLRMVSFDKGIGRLSFADGSGDVVVQCFTLADGQTCMKLQLRWTGSEQIKTHSLYPQGNFQWDEQVGVVADSWMEGPPVVSMRSTGGFPALDPVAALG